MCCFGLYFFYWRYLLPVQRSIHLQKFMGWCGDEIKFQFIIIALEHLEANEQWILWSTAHMEDCSLGLLHDFGFVMLYFLPEWRKMILEIQVDKTMLLSND